MRKNWNLFLILAMAAALIFPSAALAAPTELILGQSKIIIPNGALVGVQVDRVIRDSSGGDKEWKLGISAYPFLMPTDKKNMIPYMEGRLTGNLMDYAKVRVIGLAPAYAKFSPNDGHYLADDGLGNFRFRVDPTKVEFKSTLYGENHVFAMMPDTHGFNTVAGQAMRFKQAGAKLAVAIACMDLSSKAQAALYLAQNGINCYGPCDRFGSEILGYKKENPGAATIIGTAPVRKSKQGGATIGNQPVKIGMDEPIVVQFTEKGYPDQYCDTPSRYFRALAKNYGLKLKVTEVEANVGETSKLVAAAKENGAKVIGVRVHNEQDAVPVAQWLKEDPKNRAILFHSAPYEPGYNLFFLFPKQTSFGDLNPILK